MSSPPPQIPQPSGNGARVRNVYVYIDNSNLFIQGQRTSALKQKLESTHDLQWRFDAGRVTRLIEHNLNPTEPGEEVRTHVSLFGSTPPPVDTVWRAMEAHNVSVTTFARSNVTGKEKQVDASLVVQSSMQAMKDKMLGASSEFVIVSGDADIYAAVEAIAVTCGFIVHVWSWENGLASVYRRLPEAVAGLVRVHLLDRYMDHISFRGQSSRTAEHSRQLSEDGFSGSGAEPSSSPNRTRHDIASRPFGEPRPLGDLHRRNEPLTQRWCTFRHYCKRELDCTYGHTDEEKHQFSTRGHDEPRRYEWCRNGARCPLGERCLFAHSDAELFCPTCDKRASGHQMRDCPESMRRLPLKAKEERDGNTSQDYRDSLRRSTTPLLEERHRDRERMEWRRSPHFEERDRERRERRRSRSPEIERERKELRRSPSYEQRDRSDAIDIRALP